MHLNQSPLDLIQTMVEWMWKVLIMIEMISKALMKKNKRMFKIKSMRIVLEILTHVYIFMI
jgi:hypothetical protein